MSETGVIKFQCEHIMCEVSPFAGFAELNACRRKLQQLRMLGVDATGIGFGNLSLRDGDGPAFYITGSGTGALPQLQLSHIARVTAYNFQQNWVGCEGATVASSESLTHAAVYESAPIVRAVVHGHNARLWERLLHRVPTTSRDVEYGTSEMAVEVQRLFRDTDVLERKIFVMAGHPEGIVTFGETLDQACEVMTTQSG